jgi:predicted MPP superfamily phosphohydrolase
MWKIILIIGTLLGSYSLIEPYLIEKKRYTIDSPDIPQAFDGSTIVFLTDIHHGPHFSRSRITKLVDQTNNLKPDIIVLGGDYIEDNAKFISPCFDELKRLQAPLGVYGVLGNHDYWKGANQTRQAMASGDIKLLENHAFWITKGIQKIRIGGVGVEGEERPVIGFTTSEVTDTDFVLLISHYPNIVKTITDKEVDLVLAGDTHGGQVTFFGLFAPMLFPYTDQPVRTGMHKLKNTSIIVSNGIGTVDLPIRFFARPQIVIIKLNRR